MAVILKLTFLLVAFVLLSDFILAEKFYHFVFSPSSKRKSSAEKLSECLEDEILVTEQEPKCYPKVHQLFQECERNQQCMPSNSYCGFSYNESEDLEQLMCLCIEKLINSHDNTTCGIACEESMQFDSIKNVSQLSNDCPSPTQVCRQGICFCPTGFSINRNGDCVEQNQTTLDSQTENSNVLNNVENPDNHAQASSSSSSLLIYGTIGTVAALLAIVLVIGLGVYYRKKHNSASNGARKTKEDGFSAEDRELETFKLSE